MSLAEKLYATSAVLMLGAATLNLFEAKSHFDATDRANRVASDYEKLQDMLKQSYDDSLTERIKEHQALQKCEAFILHGCTSNDIEKFLKAKENDEL